MYGPDGCMETAVVSQNAGDFVVYFVVLRRVAVEVANHVSSLWLQKWHNSSQKPHSSANDKLWKDVEFCNAEVHTDHLYIIL